MKNKLVSGGNSTESRHCPWVATIFRQTKGGKFKYSCGGTLIGQQAILTAAHCVSDEKINTLPINVFKIFLATLSSIFEENLKEGAKVFSVINSELKGVYTIKYTKTFLGKNNQCTS